MKILPLKIAFIATALFACTPNGKTIPQKETEIRTVLKQQLVGWNAGSVDSFMLGYWESDSLQFITKKGAQYGFNTVKSMYKKSYPTKVQMGNLDFEVLKIKWLDEQNTVAQVLGKWRVLESTKSNEGYFSLVFKYINGKPKIIIDHTF